MSKFYLGYNGQKIRMIGVLIILMMLCIGVVSAAGLTTADLASGVTAGELVNTLLGSGVTASNVQYVCANRAAGTFSGGTGIIGFNDGIILSSGDIKNVIGPNINDGITADNGLVGDAVLDSLIPGYQTLDACVLEFDFVPTSGELTFDYVFTSDEYNEYANSAYNDVFGFFLNGNDASHNIALIPGTTTPVAINNVNGGNPYGTNAKNAIYYRNNDLNDGGGSINTEMDGLTTVFTATASVNAGQTNHIKLAIADVGDRALDSNVFIKAGSFSAAALTLQPSDATNTVGQTHVLTATYAAPTGADPSGVTVTFTITAGPNTGMTGTGVTDANGQAHWSYISTQAGTDTIIASVGDPIEQSNNAYKVWVTSGGIPEFPTLAIPFGAIGILLVVGLYFRKR